MTQIVSQMLSVVLSQQEYSTLLRYFNVNETSIALKPYSSDSESGFSLTSVIRTNLRLFAKIYILLTAVRNFRQAIASRSLAGLSFFDSQFARIALSVSSISASYKVLYKILLEAQPRFKPFFKYVEEEQKKLQIPFAFESHTFTPFVAGLASGSLIAIWPHTAGREILGVYIVVRAGEMVFNYIDDLGLLQKIKPKFFGSWALFPFAFAQMFHSFFFNPETNTNAVNRLLTKLSLDFMPARPAGYVGDWPTPEQVVRNISQVAVNNYPKFTSTLMFPNSTGDTYVPDYLRDVRPVVLRAHPSIKTMTGAILHPFEPSNFKFYAEICLKKLSSIGKYVFALYLVLGLISLRREQKRKDPKDADSEERTDKIIKVLQTALQAVPKAVRTTVIIAMSTVSAWANIELFQHLFGSKFLSKHRFKFSGFLAGLWAMIDQGSHTRGRYLFAFRAAGLSYWRVLVKEGRIKGAKGLEVWFFAWSFAILMCLFDRNPKVVSGKFLRKVLGFIKNDEFKDPLSGEEKIKSD